MFKKIALTCCLIFGYANASNSNVASLTDVKEALHFLLKDYNEQSQKIKLIEERLGEVDKKTKNITSNSLSSSNQVKNNINVSSDDDKIILDYLKERK